MQVDLGTLMNEAIRSHIRSCGARIGSVVYFKKDGTIRRLRFQVAAGPPRVKGTERGIRATATRAANYPEQMLVYEIGNGFRTVNLDKVLTVKAGGVTTRYRHPQPVGDYMVRLVPVAAITFGTVEQEKA